MIGWVLFVGGFVLWSLSVWSIWGRPLGDRTDWLILVIGAGMGLISGGVVLGNKALGLACVVLAMLSGAGVVSEFANNLEYGGFSGSYISGLFLVGVCGLVAGAVTLSVGRREPIECPRCGAGIALADRLCPVYGKETRVARPWLSARLATILGVVCVVVLTAGTSVGVLATTRSAGWVEVSAGPFYTLAVKEDGSLRAWGSNGSGQLGDGTLTDRPLAVCVGTDSDWATVSAGAAHTLAIKKDGSLWGWGLDWLTRSMEYEDEPRRIGSDSDWALTSVGSSHCFSLKSDGTLRAWGSNGRGMWEYSYLGDGSTVDRWQPVEIR